MNNLISAKKLGVLLGVHKVTIYRWVKASIITPKITLPCGEMRFVFADTIQQLDAHHSHSQ
jgi:hypothetical protein